MFTLFLDFDGVLFDTLKEAYVLCRKVFDGVNITDSIGKEYEIFYKYKFLVYNIWQYYYLIQAVKFDDVEARFNSLVQNRDLRAEKEFESQFVKERIKNSEFLDTLETPYPFWEKIKTRKDIVIISRKNSFAIRRRIGDGYKIVGKEELDNVVDKAEFIKDYMQKNNVERAVFIDDNSHNLKPCENIKNLTCILAGWGNIGINEVGLTQEEVLKILKIS